MSINLLDMVKSAVVGQVADQIGSAVGLDKSKTSAAVNAVLPALLGGMTKKASTPSGASDLIKALQDNDNSILDNLAGAFAPAKQASMLDYGMKLLPMLLGGSQSTIISLIAKMFGFGDKGASSLLGMLAPVVMSIVGKQVKSQGLDAGGLASLLSGQTNFLNAALPSELKNVMGFADLGGSNRPAATSGQRTTASHSAPEAGNPLKFLLPLLLLAALGYAGYQFLKPKPPAATDHGCSVCDSGSETTGHGSNDRPQGTAHLDLRRTEHDPGRHHRRSQRHRSSGKDQGSRHRLLRSGHREDVGGNSYRFGSLPEAAFRQGQGSLGRRLQDPRRSGNHRASDWPDGAGRLGSRWLRSIEISTAVA